MTTDPADELPPLVIGDRRRHAARYNYPATPWKRPPMSEAHRRQAEERRRQKEAAAAGKPPPAPISVNGPVSSFVVDPEVADIGDGWGRYEPEALSIVGGVARGREEW
ncbi:MAG: hypothetical protein AB7P02_12735 [Alphaproteobacteria bacterium]